MALSIKTGTLTVPSITGNQAITGLGFQPKLVLFFANAYKYSSTDIIGPPPWSGDIVSSFKNSSFMMGCGISASDNKVQGFLSESDLDISNVYATRNTSKCIRIISGSPLTIQAESSIVSLDADGFTLNWTTVDTVFLRDVHYIAFGGDTILNAKSGASTTPLSASQQTITGLGFKPDLLIMFAVSATTSLESNSNSNVSGSIGFATLQTQHYNGFRLRNNVTTTITKTRTSNTKCFAHVSDTDVFSEASLVSFNNDGFTLDWNTISGTADYYYYIAISGGAYKTGTIDQPIVASIQEITNIGFPPKGAILFSDNKVESALTTDHARLSVSLNASSSDSRSLWFGDKHNVGTSLAFSDFDIYPSFKIMTEATPLPTQHVYAKYHSNLTNSFKINWTTVDSTVRKITYLTFGDKVLTETYNKFIFHGQNSSTNTSKIVLHGKSVSEKLASMIFEGRLSQTNVTRFIFSGLAVSQKTSRFVFSGKNILGSYKSIVFSGLNQLSSYKTFAFNGKVLSGNVRNFLFHGITTYSNINKFVFNGYSSLSKQASLIFEGNSDAVQGNFALFRIDLSGLPTTSQVIGARLDLTVGFTSGSYIHELWTLDSTGNAWSDTTATWNESQTGVSWSQSLGASYGGGYSNRKNKVSQRGTAQDEERVSFYFNSTGIAYIQSQASLSAQFVLLSNYTGSDYAYYRSVEDSDVVKRPEFFADYIITSPSKANVSNFIFAGKNVKETTSRFVLHGYDLTNVRKNFLFHGKSEKQDSRYFVYNGKDSLSSQTTSVFHGKQSSSSSFRFVFSTNDMFSSIHRFVFNGISTLNNVSKFIFNGYEITNKLSKFVFSGKIASTFYQTIIFNGIGTTSSIFRFYFESGTMYNQRMSFVFEGRSSFRFGYDIHDHNITTIRDKNSKLIKDNVTEHFSSNNYTGIFDKTGKNIKSR